MLSIQLHGAGITIDHDPIASRELMIDCPVLLCCWQRTLYYLSNNTTHDQLQLDTNRIALIVKFEYIP